jgi:hypothetical protein
MTKNSGANTDAQHSTNANGKEIIGFVPTKGELIHLAKYWVGKAIDDDYFIFWGQCYGSSDFRRIDFYWERVNEIAQILGKEETDKAVTKAYEETALEYEREDWIVCRYGTNDERRAYQDRGGQCLSDFAPGEAEQIAQRVVQRVFREGTSEEQQALLRDELSRYAKRLYSYNRGRDVVEIFGICFPRQLRSLIPSKGVDVANPQPNETVRTINIERGKAFVAMLDEAAKKGEGALKALVTGYE